VPFFTPDTPPENEFVFRRFRIPKSTDVLGLINGAMLALMQDWNYVQRGDMTPEETAWMFRDLMVDYWESAEWMIGLIVSYITENPPPYTLPCDGGTYLKADYPELYALLDPTFIISSTEFTTPDLRGRTIVGVGQGSGLTLRAVGDTFGTETHQLTEAELAAHVHEYSPAIVGDLDVEGVGIPQPNAAQIVPLATYNTYSTGGDIPHENIQPSLAISYAVIAK